MMRLWQALYVLLLALLVIVGASALNIGAHLVAVDHRTLAAHDAKLLAIICRYTVADETFAAQDRAYLLAKLEAKRDISRAKLLDAVQDQIAAMRQLSEACKP